MWYSVAYALALAGVALGGNVLVVWLIMEMSDQPKRRPNPPGGRLIAIPAPA